MKTLVRVAAITLAIALVVTVDAAGAPRKVLAELVTSTTCAPCYGADVFYFQNWLPNYGGADQIITLAYHVWWPTPGNDPMYLANTVPVQARVSYYGTNAAPNLRVDGFVNAGSGFNTWPGAIEPRFIDASPVAIVLSGTRNGTTVDITADITADQPVNSSTWRVHFVVVESGISAPQNSGSGYVPFVHEWVHRTMLPDANGVPITITQGQTVTFQRSITLAPAWVPENCKIIVFVQNNTDKKVQNAEVIGVDVLAGADEPEAGLPTSPWLSPNYPNPFNPETRIRFGVPGTGYVRLSVIDLLGREVAVLVDEQRGAGRYTETWDARDLPSGSYFTRLTVGSTSITRKLVLLK